ncbi:MAG: hypothetical protein ACYC9O_10265 [Candidatus Latescibacterota bacterium]
MKRVSWGSIFAGAFIGLATLLTLALLGMALGLSSVRPTTAGVGDISTGAAIWWVISFLVSLFIGGWVAGRLAGVPSRLIGALHGVATWGLSSVIMIYLLATTVGVLLGGTFGVLQSAVAGTAPEALQAARERGISGMMNQQQTQRNQQQIERSQQQRSEMQKNENVTEAWSEIRDEVSETFRDQPAAGQQPDTAAADQFFNSMQGALNDGQITSAERQSLVSALTARTDLSPEDAGNRVDDWTEQYQEAQREDQEAIAEAEGEEGEGAFESVTDALSSAALWAFLALLLGAAAAAAGGAAGAPFDEGTRMYYAERPAPAERGVVVEEEVVTPRR